MKRSKAYRKAEELVDASRLYTPAEAVTLAKEHLHDQVRRDR